MPISLDLLIRRTEAAVEAEKDPAGVRRLTAKLAALRVARAEMDGEDEDDDKKSKDEDEDEEEESKAEKAAAASKKAKAKADAAKHKAKAAEHRAKAAEYDDAAKKCEEGGEGDEEAKAMLAAGPSLALSPGAAAAVASQGEIVREALKRIELLEKDTASRQLNAMIAEAKAERRITPGEAKKLAGKSSTFVKGFLEMRPHALVATDEEALSEPDRTEAADVPAFAKALIEQDITLKGIEGDEAKKYREQSYAAHRAAQSGALNGAGGVY